METTEWDVQFSVERLLSMRETAEYSANTLRGMRAELRFVIQFFGADKKVRTIQPEEMMTFLKWRAEGLNPGSQNKMYDRVLDWLRFCERAGTGMRGDLTENWRRAPKPVIEHTYVPPEAMPHVLQVAGARDPRDRMLVALIWYTGLRSIEISGLKVGDADMRTGVLDAGRVKVHDKLRVQMEPGLRAELSRWFGYYRATLSPFPVTPDLPLIPGRGLGTASKWLTSKPLGSRAQRGIVRETLLAAGFEGVALGTHTLRRSAGQAVYDQLAEAGDADPLNQARIFLGHSSRAVTEGYLNRSNDERIAAKRAALGLLTIEDESPEVVAHATVIDLFSRRYIA